jgi:hypothetical protein
MKSKISSLFAINLILVMISGCSTPQYQTTPDISLSVGTITKVVISSFPGGLREKSQNGRELLSEYFSPTQDDPHFDSEKSQYRAYVKAIVLGDRRPYTLDLGVFIEERVGPKVYNLVMNDKKLTTKYHNIINEKLAQSREDRNVIDDFRPF